MLSSFATKAILFASIYLAQTTASPSPRNAGKQTKHSTIPLTQFHHSSPNLVHQAQHTAHRYRSRHGGFAIEPEYLNSSTGFWYGSFALGASTNLTLLIDTGSDDVGVNPDLYSPGPHSLDLGIKGQLYYATTQENGCGFAAINYTQYADTMTVAGLVSSNQTFANIYHTTPPNNGTITQFQIGGIVGFAGTAPNQTQLDAKPFFQSLCDEGQVDQCRFGLAYGTDGKGVQVLGGIEKGLVEGELEYAPLNSFGEWVVNGSVVVNGSEIVEREQLIVLDSGTANIVGPVAAVRTLFTALSVQAVQQNLPGCTSVLFGYYPCDAPPTVGFQLGSSNNSVFNIEPANFQQADNGDNNCTAIVTGIDLFPQGSTEGLWILGQSWFQGKYVDFDDAEARVGVAELKDKTCGGY